MDGKKYRKYMETSQTAPLLKIIDRERSGEDIQIATEKEKIVSPFIEVLREITMANIILGTGHVSVQEIKKLVEEAKKIGIKKILVNHPELNIINMFLKDQIDLAKKGVYFERCFFVATPLGQRMDPAKIAEAIRTVGPESTILATDLGQVDNPSPVEGLQSYIRSILKRGITKEEIEIMVRVNPLRLING